MTFRNSIIGRLILVFILELVISAPICFALEVGKHKTYELVFTAANSPQNPFDTYLLKIEITDPNGRKFILDGFY